MPSSGHSYLRDLSKDSGEVSPADFDSVFRRYAPYVSTIVYRLLGDRRDVEDLVQDVFIDAYRGIDSLENPDSLKGWLSVIAVRKVRGHIGKLKLKRFIGIEDAPGVPELVEKGASPEQSAMVQQIYRELQRMRREDRLAWTLRHVQGMTISEVSAACECSVSTTKRRISRAEAILEEAVSHE